MHLSIYAKYAEQKVLKRHSFDPCVFSYFFSILADHAVCPPLASLEICHDAEFIVTGGTKVVGMTIYSTPVMTKLAMHGEL